MHQLVVTLEIFVHGYIKESLLNSINAVTYANKYIGTNVYLKSYNFETVPTRFACIFKLNHNM